ncbi:putative membrane protein YczE [Terracoccus luteus]|uniref:Putative membrane protein YczE n=1 Tax=Terracoccus luteus TaxID=53356 RepID=A0A495XWA8_9MICO|nr:hypothetical protein [Terracoccus luteus]RKT77016.1 putative membrane protein YczE [Terracoccus luteus]
MARSAPLLPLTPLQQLTAGRLPRRVAQLLVGLVLYGVSMAMMIRGAFGLDPWDVFHAGLADRVPLSFGEVTIAVGALVLLLWWPLRQWPGLGTVANVVVVGLAADAGLSLLAQPESLWVRVLLLVGGLVLNAVAGGLYIGSQLGPGPRDGLMTGLARRTGWSIRLVRTLIEVSVLAVGWLLGGPVGVGTVVYAFGIGPLVQFFLPLLTVRLDPARAGGPGAGPVVSAAGRRAPRRGRGARTGTPPQPAPTTCSADR